MIFLIRAAFWTAVVSAFIPSGFYAPQDGAFARQATEIASHTFEGGEVRATRIPEVCEGREALCEAAGEFSRFAGWAASMAADSAETAYQDYMAGREARPAEPRTSEAIFAAAAGEPAAR